mgnify:CR=1 FL=1
MTISTQNFVKQIEKCINELNKLKDETFRIVPQAYCLSAFVLLQQARRSIKEEIINEDN